MKTLKYIRSVFFILALTFPVLFLQAQEDGEGLIGEGEAVELRVMLPGMEQPEVVEVISYNGIYLFAGDIVIEEDQIVPEGTPAPGRGGTYDYFDRWPSSTIPYTIKTSYSDANIVVPTADIQWAVDHINNNTNVCLVPRTTETHYIEVVTERNVPYCGSSRVGRGNGKQILRVNQGCSTLRGSIVHEFLHALGFYHEHMRNDRDNFVRIHRSRMREPYKSNDSKFNANYRKLSFWFTVRPGAYDYGSIMHYPPTAGRASGQTGPTIEALQTLPSGVTMGQRSRLSALDISAVNDAYPNACGGSSDLAEDPGGDVAFTEDGRTYIDYDVDLIAQTTEMSCWAAGAAMIVNWMFPDPDRSISPNDIASGIGYWRQFHLPASQGGGLPPADTTMFSYWGLTPEAPQSYSVEAFVDLMRYGPLWVASAVPGPHIRVISAINSDGTPEGTILTIQDPWQRGMRTFRMPNTGSTYELTYQEFIEEYERLGHQEQNIPNAVYIAHP